MSYSVLLLSAVLAILVFLALILLIREAWRARSWNHRHNGSGRTTGRWREPAPKRESGPREPQTRTPKPEPARDARHRDGDGPVTHLRTPDLALPALPSASRRPADPPESGSPAAADQDRLPARTEDVGEPARDEPRGLPAAEHRRPDTLVTPAKGLPALPSAQRPESATGQPEAAAARPRRDAEAGGRPARAPGEATGTVWLHTGAATSAGRHRRRNEDAHFADPDLVVVADGVGGGPAGDVAAKLAVDAVVRAWRRSGRPTHHHLEGGFRDANAAVGQYVRTHPRLRGMATTLDACVVVGDRIVGAHVGDGSVWAVSPADRSVRLVTKAHAEPRGPLLRVIGSPGGARPDLWEIAARPDTRLILSSDGLVADQDERSVRKLIGSTLDVGPAETASILLKSALKAGGSDNITVIVADIVLTGPIAQPLSFGE
ncbi:PP2C family protein-serine/threonine phosphatase [Actinacidiphila acididurans]|uniref:Protein phosphatase 2C domain-containing protein n=1 Tax=Actinacidiphila acididurans TaxID=2784346 RepID=A0ABS2U2W9_9ACTN|nr:protein phosphatase 2C domain-containing protein [Actinacidiphila acididurans]MBM9509096.1 protein phosphatase 2C domain-containing protein [Actinacidiphila acididurans]